MKVQLMQMATDLVGAYVSHNATPQDDLPKLLAGVHAVIIRILSQVTDENMPTRREIGKSITAEFVLCLECGKRFKSMRRHVMAQHGLLPDQYRDKWGLPPDYPMVAPNYSATRARLAKISELGRKPEAKRGRKGV